MNEFVYIFGSVLAVGVMVGLYYFFAGVNGNLADAKEGEVYHFKYLQPSTGEAERYMVKIIGKQQLTVEQINRLNARSNYRKYDPIFMRTGHLVTGQSKDGKIRNFYAERTVDCKRSLLGNLMSTIGAL